MKTFRAVIVALVMITSVLFAPKAKGQTTASAVVPAVLPKFALPIGNEDAVNAWIVTNRQWNLYAEPLGVHSDIRIYYWSTNGVRSPFTLSTVDQEYASWLDFEKKLADAGSQILEHLKKNPKVDTSRPLETAIGYGTEDWSDPKGISGETALYMKKSLGLLSEVTRDSFIGGFNFIIRRILIRIDNMEEFEVVSKDSYRRLLWKAGDPVKANVGQIEQIRKGVVNLDGNHYIQPDPSVSFRIRAGGQERVYNSSPTLRILDPSRLEINLIGLETRIESSFNLEQWAPYREFQVEDGGVRTVYTYPPPNSQKQMFFRMSFVR